jgi:hypothetical protein
VCGLRLQWLCSLSPEASSRRRRVPTQDLVCDFIGGVAVAATRHAQLRTGVPKLSTEDVIGVVRKDAARLTRAKELVTANEETRKALKVAQPDNKDLAELGK